MLERLCTIYSFGEGTEEIWRKALEDGRVRLESFEGISFFRVNKDVKGLKRGTILSEEGIVMAYPRIPRVFHLSRGIERNLHSPFYIEEKVDGYNIRIAKIGNKILAFTRGGFVCPFTTERLGDYIDAISFFRAHPDLVLCCEVAGPENPYNPESPPYLKEDVGFFIFDIMEKGTGRLMAPKEKYGVIKRWNLPGVRVLGIFSPNEVEKIKGVVIELHREGLEGIVIKPVADGKVFKYVTPSAHLKDLQLGGLMIKDLPSGYFIKRLLMLSISMTELGMDKEEGWPEVLGRAFFEPLFEAIRKVENGERIGESFTIKFKRRDTIDQFMAHLRRICKVDVELIEKKKEADYWRVLFTRRYRETEKSLRAGLRGALSLD